MNSTELCPGLLSLYIQRIFKLAYTLIIGNKNYSSWSMRAWLLLEFLGVPYQEESVALYTATSRRDVLQSGGETGLVPVLKDDGLIIWETSAIVEYLYERFPQVWPGDRALRARARSICGEVYSGMNHLRNAMPVNTRARYKMTDIPPAATADINRVVEIWENALALSGGPWLFKEFTAADIVFAPIATRFQTYGVTLVGEAAAYQERILSHPLVSRWLALGKQEPGVIEIFEDPFSSL